MTKEKAIKILNTVLAFGKCDCLKEEAEECLKMAIKALTMQSKQPEIIQCKDCKWFRRWIDTEIEFCDLTESTVFATDYCSKAERKEE